MREWCADKRDFRMFMMGRGRGQFGGRHGHYRPHGGRGGGYGGEHLMRRILGHGDLRYVILALLEEKPSHGYELIKALEEKSAGQYSPSPGVIYPTLTFLEEGGYATATANENKKLYTITEAGKTLLAENREFVAEIFDRLKVVGEKMSRLRDWFGKEEVTPDDAKEMKETKHTLRSAMHQLKVELFARMPLSKDQQKKVVEIVTRAIQELRELK